jgi:double stranded RNA-specific editase B
LYKANQRLFDQSTFGSYDPQESMNPFIGKTQDYRLQIETLQLSIFNESLIQLSKIIFSLHSLSAVAGRIEAGLNTKKLPPQYYLNKPFVAQTTHTGPNLPVLTPFYSVNWTFGQRSCEIVQSYTGKTVGGQVSRLTKQTFFKRYAKLAKKYNLSHYDDNKFYGEVKESIENHKVSVN